MSDPDRL